MPEETHSPDARPVASLRLMTLLLAAVLAVQILALVLPHAGFLDGRATYGEECDEVLGDKVYDFGERLCDAAFGASSFRVPHDADWDDPATEMYRPSFSGDWVLRDEDG